MKIFQVAILLHPTQKDKEAGAITKIIIPITSILAVDQQGAVLQAGRMIAEDYLQYLDRLEVAVRPF